MHVLCGVTINLWQPQQGTFKASEKLQQLTCSFLCRVFHVNPSSKYRSCLASEILQDLVMVHHTTPHPYMITDKTEIRQSTFL